MKLKQVLAGVLAVAFVAVGTACGMQQKAPEPDVTPSVSRVKSICDLSVMECYYHNVAKFNQKDAEGVLFWKKDKRFWVEYSGIVKVGVDASKVEMTINGTEVTITIPEAEVLDSKVDSSSLNKDSYIVAKDSVAVNADDEVEVLRVAQEEMEKEASRDKALLAAAQQRAQQLLEDYVLNIGSAVGKNYSIKWKYLKNSDIASSAAQHS